MSGAEALAVISIIANIVTLAEFSRDVISQIKEYGENAHEVPKAFRDIQAVLPLISSTLMRTRDQVESRSLDDGTCKVLRPVLERCEKKLKQLRLVFQDVMVQEGASKLKRGFVAIKSVRKHKEVKEIAQALDRFAAHLAHYHASEGLTSKDIESLRVATSSMSVGQPETEPPKTQFLVPVQWSDDFTGREEAMACLGSRLCLEDQHSRVALVGLGGMGKTRIALQYAKKFKKSSLISVFWVYAGTVERFNNAYREIARKLQIPGHQDPGTNVLNTVKDHLQDNRSGRWLMILDNADDAEIMYGSGSLRLADYLPRSDKGSILLTTRFQKVGASFASGRNIIRLQSMTLEESELLLRARVGSGSPGEQHELYQELAIELERTPLALVQAASFMCQNCIPLDSYLRMYRESDVSKIRLLSENFEDDVRDSEAKNPIATTWTISFEYVSIHVPQAAELLSLMSMLDAQSIPDFLIAQGEDAISFNEAIGTLEAFSFISMGKQSRRSLQPYRVFDLHPLVRLAIRNWLSINNAFFQRTAQVLKILALRCSETESENFEISSLVLPHALELLASDLLQWRSSKSQLFETGNSDRPSLSEMYFISTTTSTQYQEEIHFLETVDTVPKLMTYTAELLDYVALIFHGVGNLIEAKRYAAKSVAINTRIWGQRHGSTLLSMRLLASILRELGEFKRAEQLGRQQIAICEAEYGIQDVLTLGNLLELRASLSLQERKQEAKEIGEVIVQRCRQSLLRHKGEKHLEILSMLAEIHLSENDFQEAEKCAMLALHGYQATNDDFEAMTVLRHLSRVYEGQHKWGLAIDTKKSELDIRIKHHGQNHPSTIDTRYVLAHTLLHDRRTEEARRQASLALERIGQIHGPSSDTYAHYDSIFGKLFADRCE